MSDDEAVPAVASEAPATDVGDNGVADVAVEVAPDVAVDTSVDESADPFADWNGELSSLRGHDAFSSLDNGVRDSLLRGIEKKYRNYQQGFTAKTTSLSDRERQLTEQETRVKRDSARWQRWMQGDGNPVDELQAQIAEMKTQHGAAIEALRGEREQLIKEAQGKWGTERDQLVSEARKYQTELNGIKEAQQTAWKKAEEDAAAALDGWIEENATDIRGDDGAYFMFLNALAGGASRDQATKAARAAFDLATPAAKPTPEEVPADVDMMSPGASPAVDSNEHEDPETVLRRMMRAATIKDGVGW